MTKQAYEEEQWAIACCVCGRSDDIMARDKVTEFKWMCSKHYAEKKEELDKKKEKYEKQDMAVDKGNR